MCRNLKIVRSLWPFYIMFLCVMVLCLLRASAPGFVIMPLSQSETEKWLRGQKWSRKKITRKNGSLEDASLFTHIIWQKSCKNREYYSSRLLYHHLKTFLWLLLLKFVTQESRGRIFKSTNELLDRIITISGLPSRQSSPTCFQESAGGVLQSGKRIPSKFKPSNGAAARRPRPTAPQPTKHSYRWDL